MRYTILAVATIFILVAAACTRIDQVPTPEPFPTATTNAASAIPNAVTTVAATPVEVEIQTPAPTPTSTPATPTSIDDLAWVADGIQSGEIEVFEALRALAKGDGVEPLILEKRWLHYRVDFREIEALLALAGIDRIYGAESTEIVLRILEMPILDNLDEDDTRAVEFMLLAAERDAEATRDVILGLDTLPAAVEDSRVLPLSFLDRRAADSIRNLEWFANGVSRSAAPLLYNLALIRLDSPEAFEELIQAQWLNESQPLPRDAVAQFARISTGSDRDSASALAIARMPFVEKGEAVLPIMERFATIHERANGRLAAVLANPNLNVEISPLNLGVVVVASIEEESPAFAETLWALSWATDDLTNKEADFFERLDAVRLRSTAIDAAIVRYQWIANGIADEDIRMVRNLSKAIDAQNALAEQITDLQWLYGDITWPMADAVDGLGRVNAFDPKATEILLDLAGAAQDDETARDVVKAIGSSKWRSIDEMKRIANLSWIADGITKWEAHTLLPITYIQAEAPDSVAGTLALPWIADGITSSEEIEGCFQIQRFATVTQGDDPEPNIAGYEAYAELIAKPWIVDGVSPTEAAVIEGMKNLVHVEETRIGELLRFLVRMPFLNKISGVEQGIVTDIREFLERYRRRALEAFLDSDSSPQIDDTSVLDDFVGLLQ